MNDATTSTEAGRLTLGAPTMRGLTFANANTETHADGRAFLLLTPPEEVNIPRSLVDLLHAQRRRAAVSAAQAKRIARRRKRNKQARKSRKRNRGKR